jgi:uncharacterized protein YodC (DUF2158 family)
MKADCLRKMRLSGPTSGGGFETRWFANSRIQKEKKAFEGATLREMDALMLAEALADE